MALTPPASGEPVRARVRAGDGYERVELAWPEALQAPVEAQASVENNVYVARFSRPADFDPTALAAASERIAIARLDADQRTLRLALRQPVRAVVSASANMVALDLVDPDRPDPPRLVSPRERAERQAAVRRAQDAEDAREQAAFRAAPSPPLPLNVRAAEASDYTRLVFDWTRPVDFALETAPERALVRFSADAAPDLAALNATPPKRLRRVQARHEDGRLAVALALEPGHEARAWRDENRVVVDIFPAAAVRAPPQPAPAPDVRADVEEQVRPSPVPPPPAAPIRAEASAVRDGVRVGFAWPAPVGAAAFRRGDSLWIVFDAPAAIDLSGVARASGRTLRGGEALQGPDFAAVRFDAGPSAQIAVAGAGREWTFAIADTRSNAPSSLAITRVAGAGEPGQLRVGLRGPRRAVRLRDPVLGDTLVVVTAEGPPRGVLAERRYAELTVLASAHGIAVETVVEDVAVGLTPDAVILSRPGGLALSPTRRVAEDDAVIASVFPGFINFEGEQVAPAAFIDAHNGRLRTAAQAQAPQEALLSLAQFLIANGLAAEAMGALAQTLSVDATYLNDPRLRARRGVASLMMGRRADAAEDFKTPGLGRDPAAALWRGRLAAQAHDWRAARRAFAAGEEALYLYGPAWRARFLADSARAALELGDTAAAKALVADVMSLEAAPETRLAALRVLADYHERLGDVEAALALNREVAAAGYPPLESKALFHVTRLERAEGLLDGPAALERLEQLHLRWRGDDTELQIAHELARVYREAGEPRAALTLMRAVVRRFPEHPLTRSISIDMAETFRALFLDGAGIGDPIEALALWYEFRDLTPVGADGDRLIRRLADRLVDFDLLPQAAELLQHQVDNRLRGAARALIATDLAAVYLMDRNPEAALRVIADTRITRLPEAVNRERRLIQARALAELGRNEHALELLSVDRSAPAARLRADITWRAGDWPRAGRLLVDSLGDAWRAPGPLSADQANRALRAAVALTLAGDDDALEALNARYGVKMRRSPQAAAWALVVDDARPDGGRLQDLAREIASEDTVDAFVKAFRARRAATDALAAEAAAADAPGQAVGAAVRDTSGDADDASGDADG